MPIPPNLELPPPYVPPPYVPSVPPAPRPTRPYNVFDWYWIVGGSTTQVYSSKAKNFVPVGDANFVAWKNAGNIPTNVDTHFNLGGALGIVNEESLKPVEANVLDGYADKQAEEIVLHAAFKILFNHENRLRAIERNLGLNGSPPDLTKQQAKNAVKQLMM